MPLVIDFPAEPPPLFSPDAFSYGFNLPRDSAWIGLGFYLLWFAGGVVYGMKPRTNWEMSRFLFLFFQVIWVPVFAFMVYWCYVHPEQVENCQHRWLYDHRLNWPFAVLFDIVLIYIFRKADNKQNYYAQAAAYFAAANRLLAQGRREEAEQAWMRGQWIMENKCKNG